MKRLTRKETIIVEEEEMAGCNHENDDCNDSCMYGRCRWQEKSNMLLKKYEDTGLTPAEIQELKERDTVKAPERAEEQPYFRKHFHTMICPACRRKIGEQWVFCAYCGKRLKRED